MSCIRLAILATAAVLMTAVLPGTVQAQSSQSSVMVGKVTDESGGAMPGVTVTVKSPQLQVRHHDGRHRYRW